jgi:hypothetical protein
VVQGLIDSTRSILATLFFFQGSVIRAVELNRLFDAFFDFLFSRIEVEMVDGTAMRAWVAL